MNFIEAFKAIIEGKKVRRATWSEEQYVHKDDICTCDKDACVVDEYGDGYNFATYEYLKEWELYEEKSKLHTFEEALAAYKNGKRIRRELYWMWIGKRDNFMQIKFTDMLEKDWMIEENNK